MRFHRACGVQFFAFHAHDSLDAILRTIHAALGAPCLIALLRALAGVGTIVTLGATARVMWVLPASVDALIAGTAALSWAVWLDQQEPR